MEIFCPLDFRWISIKQLSTSLFMYHLAKGDLSSQFILKAEIFKGQMIIKQVLEYERMRFK